MKLNLLLLGVSLFASQAWAGSISNVPGTLDTTLVDPAPALYPHFVCASGCSSGSNTGAVSQSGAWNVGVTNFPAVQTVTGTVSVLGGATAAAQPALNLDGGSLEHITNLPAVQAINGSVSVANLPVSQTVNGSVSVPGVATAANQPGLNSDGGGLAHITNWPTIQAISGSIAVSNLPPVSGTVSIGNFPATQAVSGTVSIGTSVAFGAAGSPSTYVQSVQGVTGGAPVGVTESDGSNAALGSKADAASGSGSGSVIALLKQLHLDDSGATPPGNNTIGAVNIGAQTVFDAPIVSAVLESNHVFKTSAGQLTSAYAVSTVAGYLMLFNMASAPPDGGVTPVECVPMPANVATGVSFSGLPPESYSTGITAVFSTTGCFTKTASATAFFHGAVQ